MAALAEQPAKISAFRRELLDSYLGYRRTVGRVEPRDPPRYHRWTLSLQRRRVSATFPEMIGGESFHLDPEFARGGHTINLGGAADIFRSMVDLPLADHHHTVDMLSSWAGTHYNVVSEYLQRVGHVAPNVRLEVLEEGFLPHYRNTIGLGESGPKDQRTEDAFVDAARRDAALRRPLVLRARWSSPALGSQVKHFYFHPSDFFSTAEAGEVTARIPARARLAAILLHGVGAASGGPIERELAPTFFDRLARGGAYVTGFHTLSPQAGPEELAELEETERLLAPRFSSKRLLYRPGIEIHPGIPVQELPGGGGFENTLLFTKDR